jgi:hypothetical protein
MAEDAHARDPSRTADAAIQPNEVAIHRKESEKMIEDLTHQEFIVRSGAEAAKDATSRVVPALEARPGVVFEEEGVCDQGEEACRDLASTPTTSDLVNIVDSPTSSDEATSEITNGENANPQVDDVDETAWDIVLSAAVNTTIAISPLIGDREDASCVPGDDDDVQSTKDRLDAVKNPGSDDEKVDDEKVDEVESVAVDFTPCIDDSAGAPQLSEKPAAEEEGRNGTGEVLKPQLLESNSTHDVGPAANAVKSPSAASTPLQRTRGEEENVGENAAVNEALIPDEENFSGGDNESFVNRGLAMWEQSRQKWLHRREVGGSRNSNGSQLTAIALDVVRTRLSWPQMACHILLANRLPLTALSLGRDH